ncbi:DUF362 domain-containing protein [[Eubacterium] cellulosolvens]
MFSLATVSIVKKRAPEGVIEAIELLGGVNKFFVPEDFVLIKPNVCGGVPGKIGTFTSLEVISGITSILNGKVGRIAIGESDSSMYIADRMLKENKITDHSEELGAEIINLSKGDMEEIPVQDGYVLESIKISKIITEATKIISTPIAKTHTTTQVSLNLKNMLGILPQRKKGQFHAKIDAMLADILKTFPPTLCVVDAIVGLEGFGPFHGDPIRLDLIIAGDNAVATDAVMANIMGFDPKKIMHLRLASEADLGPIHLKDIDIVGENIQEAKIKFKKSMQEPFSRTLARIPGLGHLFVHYAYENAVKSWKKKTGETQIKL